MQTTKGTKNHCRRWNYHRTTTMHWNQALLHKGEASAMIATGYHLRSHHFVPTMRSPTRVLRDQTLRYPRADSNRYSVHQCLARMSAVILGTHPPRKRFETGSARGRGTRKMGRFHPHLTVFITEWEMLEDSTLACQMIHVSLRLLRVNLRELYIKELRERVI